jgi:hypothetical protein
MVYDFPTCGIRVGVDYNIIDSRAADARRRARRGLVPSGTQGRGAEHGMGGDRPARTGADLTAILTANRITRVRRNSMFNALVHGCRLTYT